MTRIPLTLALLTLLPASALAQNTWFVPDDFPTIQLGIDEWVGSLEKGKDADFVIWSDNPLSTYAVCEHTWIDGKEYFNIVKDRQRRKEMARERNLLIQKILSSSEAQK